MARRDLESRLVNDFQRDFPLEPEPFRRIAERLGATEAEVLDTIAGLGGRGVISRVGAVVRPHTVGASTLAALHVPEDRLEAVATEISARPEVSHNYEREHELNLWFVVTAADRDRVAAVLADIERATGLEVIDLPLSEAFHIDLGFDLRCR